MNDLISEKSIIVINKIDLDFKNISQQISKFNPIFLSIKNETNLDELINRIKDKLKNKFVSSNETLITRERHRQSLEACVQNLKNFEEKNFQEDIAYRLRKVIKRWITSTMEIEGFLNGQPTNNKFA